MRRFVWIGLGVWVVATLAIRLAGERVFRTGSWPQWALLFGVTALVIAVPVYLMARRLPTRDAGLRAVVLLVLPGMLLDTGSVFWFHAVFPNLPDSAGMPFASLLLWAYGIALLAGLWPQKARR
jgi:hypothetical protein